LILDRVQQVRKEDARRGVASRPLSRAELLERERLEPQGELQEDQVVVASTQPLELGYEAILQVRDNLDNNIRYVHFFQGDDNPQGGSDAADKIPQLLQLLLLARILKPGEETLFPKRRETAKVHRDKILEVLKDICMNDKLNIYFLSERLDVEFCIHNAASDRWAKLYFKRGARDEFIEWHSGNDAYQFWLSMKKAKFTHTDSPDAVFYGTRDFPLDEGGPFLKSLKARMQNYFPDFGEEVFRLCFKGPG
jgi:hypothetical protein